jgi:pilus assembly protein Flp/PilA
MTLIDKAVYTLATRLYALKDEAGQGMAEYGLILALVAVAVIVALTALGGGISNTFNAITAKL